MSFNSLKYDVCEEKVAVEESIKPGLYYLNTPVLCNTCFQTNPQIINQKGSDSMQADVDWRFYAGPIDVDSELRNLNLPATNCPSGKYKPKCNNCGVVTSGQPCGDGVSLACHNCRTPLPKGAMCNQNLVALPDCYFPIQNTRLDNPPSTLRGTGWNHFDPICFNPQDEHRLFFQGKWRENTQLTVRDNFRPCKRTSAVNSMHPQDYLDLKADPCKLGIKDSQFGKPLYMRNCPEKTLQGYSY